MEQKETEKSGSDVFIERFSGYQLLTAEQQTKLKPIIRKFYYYKVVYTVLIWFLLIAAASLIIVSAVDSTDQHFNLRVVTDTDIAIAVILLCGILYSMTHIAFKFWLSNRINQLIFKNKIDRIATKQQVTDSTAAETTTE